MDRSRINKYNTSKPKLKGVIRVNMVESPTTKQHKENESLVLKNTKAHQLRKKLAVTSLTGKGLVDLWKEGK
ncbi:hypothetical protein [Evansella tamaricis]|uniref:Uncharacterized protein n=1 Tax=Evansella tamaricis TaxID=2069301 RepID=A0ABS6JP66_9BACI|nr:hypothetical protein [Evansella tamaricis]MBU9714098.1 hypothetical protein [Evansella tamaricis]